MSNPASMHLRAFPEGQMGIGRYLPLPHWVELAWVVVQDSRRDPRRTARGLAESSYKYGQNRGFYGTMAQWLDLVAYLDRLDSMGRLQPVPAHGLPLSLCTTEALEKELAERRKEK